MERASNLAQTTPYLVAPSKAESIQLTNTPYRERETKYDFGDVPDMINEYAGIKGQRIKKVVLSSLNGSRGNDGANFVVNVEESTIFNLRVSSMTLADVSFPGGQFLIEEDWNRVDFSDGLELSTIFRSINVSFDDSNDEFLLPIHRNPIKEVDRLTDTIFLIETEEDVGTNLTAAQEIWGNNFIAIANRFSETGLTPLGKTFAKIENVDGQPRQAKITFKNDTGLVNPPVGLDVYGTLAVSNLPGPVELVNAVNATIRARTADYSLSFSWDATTDTFSLTYIPLTKSGNPTIYGDIIQYMGFTVPLEIDASENISVTIQSRGPRLSDSRSGTRLRVGTYTSGDDIASGISNAMNASWVGRSDSALDSGAAWQIEVRGSDDVPFVACIPSGRYSPQNLAAAITRAFETGTGSTCVPSSLIIPIKASAIMDGPIYKGISFQHTGFPEMPFTLVLSSGSLTTIDPQKLGYDPMDYTGSSLYVPTVVPPYYPTIFQGSVLQPMPSQHFTVTHISSENRLQIAAVPYKPRSGEIISLSTTSGTILTIQLDVAHGCGTGMEVLVSKTGGSPFGSIYSGMVFDLDDPDPTIINILCGGTAAWLVGDVVTVTFTNSGIWSLNASQPCYQCINREVAGLNSEFYTFSQHRIFRLPNLINLIPFKYVFCVVTLNNAQGSGNTLAIRTGQKQLITAIGRILLGARSFDAASDMYDRLFETMLTGVTKISTIHVQFINPDGTFYHFHGRDTSIGLLFTIMERNVTLGI